MSVLIIAEIGVNHQGDLNNAKRLIDAATTAGADCAKFQFFSSQRLWGDDRIKHLELRFSELVVLHSYCKEVGIEFLCTPFGLSEVVLLKPLLKRWKVASGCIGRKALLENIAQTKLPVILSTGMSTLDDVGTAVDFLGAGDLTLLHCTSAYPCSIKDVNLRAMRTLREVYGRPVGYSDHTLGITVPIAAVAMGASVIEKHLTLDRSAAGPDHKASIEPDEFRVMVSAIRTVEDALGSNVKAVQPCEAQLRRQWRVPTASDR